MKTFSYLTLLSVVLVVFFGCQSDSSSPVIEGMDMKIVQKKSIPKDVLGAESYKHYAEHDFQTSLEAPMSTFSIDVDHASYSNTRRFIMGGQRPPKDAVRVEEMINYFNYDYPEPTGEHPFSFVSEVSDCPWAPGHKLVHLGLKAKDVAKTNLPPSNLVFLLDVSGSMDAENKLPLLKKSFRLLTNELRQQDKVAIVVYAGDSGVALESTNGNEKRLIRNAIHELKSGGGTAGAAGIKKAYAVAKANFIEGGNNRVILATDGDFNVGVTDDQALVDLISQKRKEDIFLTVLGFGTGNLKDAKMEQIADNGNGNYYYIDNMDEGKKVFSTELTSTIFTVAKDVKLQLNFNPNYVKEYRLVGYENRVLENKDFNDDEKDAGEMGAGHTVTALYEIIPVDNYTVASLNTMSPHGANAPDFITVKMRYKAADANESVLFSDTCNDKDLSLEDTSDNFRWSAAVAGFGMLLKDSKHKGTTSFEKVETLARKAKGTDEHGYREEFIRLVELAKAFSEDPVVEK